MLVSLLWLLQVTAERALAFFLSLKKKVKKRARGREEII